MDRAQIYTLEGIFAGLIVLLGVFFALQATATTPGSVGTNPHALQEDQVAAEDMIRVVEDEELREAILYWNESGGGFHCTPDDVEFYTGVTGTSSCSADPEYEDHIPPNEFGRTLENHFGEGYSYNVYVVYNTSGDTVSRQRMVYQGNPGLSAVRTTRTVAINDDDHIRAADGSEESDTIRERWEDDENNFYAPKLADPAAPNDDYESRLYNAVRVEVVVWRA